MALALRKIGMTLVVMLVPIFWLLADAQPSCPGALTSLTPCLSFSVNNSSSSPSSSCCSELANMLQTAPACLCNVLNGVGGQALGNLLNQSLARALPSACNMQMPPVSQCDGLNSQNTGDNAYSEGTILNTPLLLAIFFSSLAFML